MNTWLDRLLEEQKELKDKLSKLEVFIDSPEFYDMATSNPARAGLLLAQNSAMHTYSTVLTLRIMDAQLKD